MIIHYHTEYLVEVMNDHGYVSFVVVIVKPSIRCGIGMIMDMLRLS
jgi:hypothetical protein